MKQNIVVMAHDRQKTNLLTFLKEREDWLWGKSLVATGRSADFLQAGNFNIPIKVVNPGKSGGYQQITEMIKTGEVKLVIFFRDHEVYEKDYHEDIHKLLETCNIHNIPLSTNPASAELIILGLIRKELAENKIV